MLFVLPIDAVLPEIVRAFGASPNVVLEAPPGAGKTTRVPPALLPLFAGELLVLEPRRIAARMAARRVAEEMGERIGETVGYQVRFEDATGSKTRLKFLTEGVLTRRLLADPQLRNVSVVILDEFHERHLDADLALALLRRLQLTSRPDLKLMVMSATLTADPIAEYLGNCPVIRSEGRLFDVAVSYTPHSAAPLEEQVANAIQKTENDGDVLVFLPGSAEIRRAMRACEAIAKSSERLILPLYGDLSPEEQDRAVMPADRPKVILSTNVAESSITIDGVTTVIDSGLARVAADSPWTGLPTLQIQRISKASATQRAGRAGRTRPGRAVRLYSYEDFQRRPAHDVPEIHRRELSQTLLELRALGITDLPWFEAPPEEAIDAAEQLLDRLGANQNAAELARLPVHPRLARLILDADRRGAAVEACRLAALLSSGDRIEHLHVLDALGQPQSWRGQQIEKQLRRFVRSRQAGAEDGLRLAILAAFSDRVAKRRTATDVQLSNGKSARLAAEWRGDLLIAVDIEDRRELGPPLIRLACDITPEALVDLFPDHIQESKQLIWNREAERVEANAVVKYDEIVIDETRTQPGIDEAAQMLAARALDVGMHRFVNPGELESFLARAGFASQNYYLPGIEEYDVREVLVELCRGLRSFAELQTAARSQLFPALKARVGGEHRLNEIAPERLQLKSRQVKVNYVRDQQPWIASRLQDFFGLRDTPRIARGRVPVLAHLLAPNQRPVQVTADLAGFWERLYPQVRRELSRRYPRHSWPENPNQITPT
jgi:ATP-dependent helicase HrpB